MAAKQEIVFGGDHHAVPHESSAVAEEGGGHAAGDTVRKGVSEEVEVEREEGAKGWRGSVTFRGLFACPLLLRLGCRSWTLGPRSLYDSTTLAIVILASQATL